jgi:hypothetical protein
MGWSLFEGHFQKKKKMVKSPESGIAEDVSSNTTWIGGLKALAIPFCWTKIFPKKLFRFENNHFKELALRKFRLQGVDHKWRDNSTVQKVLVLKTMTEG